VTTLATSIGTLPIGNLTVDRSPAKNGAYFHVSVIDGNGSGRFTPSIERA